jgi:hypothetical protein
MEDSSPSSDSGESALPSASADVEASGEGSSGPTAGWVAQAEKSASATRYGNIRSVCVAIAEVGKDRSFATQRVSIGGTARRSEGPV